jgi:O-antigen/teichoic acid export membrane protein
MVLPAVATLVLSARVAGRLSRQAAGRAAVARVAPPRDVPEGRTARGPAGGWGGIVRDVAPIGAGLVLSALYFRVDVFVVGASRGAEAVALYSAVFRLVEALRLFPAAVLAVVLPALVRARDGRPLARTALAVTLFALAATVPLWASAGWIVRLVYGPAFAGSVPAFRILLLAFPLFSLNYALTHQLVGWDRQTAYAIVCGAALAINLALNARLVPSLGIEGAAWATLWTEIVVTMGSALALWAALSRRQPATAAVPA